MEPQWKTLQRDYYSKIATVGSYKVEHIGFRHLEGYPETRPSDYFQVGDEVVIDPDFHQWEWCGCVGVVTFVVKDRSYAWVRLNNSETKTQVRFCDMEHTRNVDLHQLAIQNIDFAIEKGLQRYNWGLEDDARDKERKRIAEEQEKNKKEEAFSYPPPPKNPTASEWFRYLALKIRLRAEHSLKMGVLDISEKLESAGEYEHYAEMLEGILDAPMPTFKELYTFLESEYLHERFQGRDTPANINLPPKGKLYSHCITDNHMEDLEKDGYSFIHQHSSRRAEKVYFDRRLRILNIWMIRTELPKKRSGNLLHVVTGQHW